MMIVIWVNRCVNRGLQRAAEALSCHGSLKFKTTKHLLFVNFECKQISTLSLKGSSLDLVIFIDTYIYL